MTLTIHLTMPEELEHKLRTESQNLEADVKDAYALELYRQERITHLELSQMLGLDRIETSELLQRHHIYVGSLTAEDLEEQRKTCDKVLGRLESK
jgi:predicted HTH domain antitoxin